MKSVGWTATHRLRNREFLRNLDGALHISLNERAGVRRPTEGELALANFDVFVAGLRWTTGFSIIDFVERLPDPNIRAIAIERIKSACPADARREETGPLLPAASTEINRKPMRQV